jgi:hypothetical protein
MLRLSALETGPARQVLTLAGAAARTASLWPVSPLRPLPDLTTTLVAYIYVGARS